MPWLITRTHHSAGAFACALFGQIGPLILTRITSRSTLANNYLRTNFFHVSFSFQFSGQAMRTEFAVRPPKPLFWILPETTTRICKIVRKILAVHYAVSDKRMPLNVCKDDNLTHKNDNPEFISSETITLANPCTLLFFIIWSKHCKKDTSW